jgi:transcriptional regulator with XRE-family HTH domain
MAGTPATNKALGKALRQIREREKLTQEDVADKAGLHSTWISAVERGVRDPRWSTVCQMAKGMGVRPMELVALAERIES